MEKIIKKAVGGFLLCMGVTSIYAMTVSSAYPSYQPQECKDQYESKTLLVVIGDKGLGDITCIYGKNMQDPSYYNIPNSSVIDPLSKQYLNDTNWVEYAYIGRDYSCIPTDHDPKTCAFLSLVPSA